jgi:polysaccharide deacetylase 2 family uncharacterized protein YibQ
MAKRKAGPSKKAGKRPPHKSKQKKQIIKALVGTAILIALVILAAVVTYYMVPGRQPRPTESNNAGNKPTAYKIPAFEIYPKEKIPEKPISKPKRPFRKKFPTVSIIIDDIGYHRKLAEKLIRLDNKLTFSILPYAPHRKRILRFAEREGAETMLHLPMEPDEYPKANPGPGALLSTMSPDELIVQLKKHLAAVPSVKGVNNHMGSKMTALSTQMYQIFSILKKRNLYFIDSRTSTESLCRPSARLLMLPFAQRDVFLDHVQDAEFIRKQLQKLIRIALTTGEAIGIGHPYRVTYEVLLDELPKLRKKVKLVPASEIVHIPG